MELLCQEAETPWLDGMLLAGCLAYGLGNYVGAEEWYRAVLRQDPGHIEAMSNLAATCHALHRREDALKYWSEAVSLRPSYFEAVEHLIGLLCASHRAREAVSVIEYVENTLRIRADDPHSSWAELSDAESDTKSYTSSINTVASYDTAQYDYDVDRSNQSINSTTEAQPPGYGTSGYAIAGVDNGRMLALVHAKGNMLYALGQNHAAAAAFEDAVLISTGQRKQGIRGLINDILAACLCNIRDREYVRVKLESKEPILLAPDQAEATARHMFPPEGNLPGLEYVTPPFAVQAAISTTSNSLLSLAKIYQDGMSNAMEIGSLKSPTTREILALYYLSLSLQRSPSTANNVGILLAGVQQSVHPDHLVDSHFSQISNIPGVVAGTGISLALMYYNFGLNIDQKHAHLFTNLGSLLKDIGQLGAAIKMYERAVSCDGNFDIALANLANAVKDQGRVADAIAYYKRAVAANPDFAEAVCGLATALNSVCSWDGRGGVCASDFMRDRLHVDERGMKQEPTRPYGWINRVVEIVEKQLKDGETWGCGTLTSAVIDSLALQLTLHRQSSDDSGRTHALESVRQALRYWSGQRWEGSRIVRLVERAIRQIGWQWYQDRYKHRREYPARKYARPYLPNALSPPSAPTVLPFHTFTAPLSAKQIRQISQRNALRISVCTLRSAWLPATVFPPPSPPSPCLNVGYVSSDFNNHPLAHLMQSVFGLHDTSRVRAICYATTASDGSIHRHQIEQEAPLFHDASTWSVERLVNQIVQDNVHILVNLNGYTRGARNEVFAARPAPIHMSFMGFAGTLGAEWCDYVFADTISVPPDTLSPWRRNVDIEDKLRPDSCVEDVEDWVYSENVIFARDTFFCVDHKQSAPDVEKGLPNFKDRLGREAAWEQEQADRWKLRKELFPSLSNTAVVLGNFNQLYKIDPATFDMYLQILKAVPNAILWLLRFPDLGEQNLKRYAEKWAGKQVADRIIFTDVAAKGAHITRASVVDLFLDTPECNAHTTAADTVWSGTPIITWGKWKYKMCSRMAGSIVASALPAGREGDEARRDLLVRSERQYIDVAIELAQGLRYPSSESNGQKLGHGRGRLMDLRRMLWEGRWTSRLFDTKRWVTDLETAYWSAWKKWEKGEGGDIWL
jgi:predicted O-linked N-acetylglucosamine transferase (SPINDLY family)